MKRAIIAGIASVAALTQAWAGDAPKNSEPSGLGKETSIPFINQDAILTWQANGQEGLWIQDTRKHWYYATILAPCTGLEFAVQLGFKTRALNQLDRDSEVVVPDSGRCEFRSLKESQPPPKGKRHSGASKEEK